MIATYYTESGSVYRFTEDAFGQTQCQREGERPCLYKAVDLLSEPRVGQPLKFYGVLWDEEAKVLIRLTRSTNVMWMETA